MTFMTNTDVLRGLFLACGGFAADAIATLDPALAVRVAPAASYVVVRLSPPRARIVAEAPSGEMAVIHQSDRLSPALAEAVRAFTEQAIQQLPAAAQHRLAVLLERGLSLGVVVARDAGLVQLVADDGGAHPRILATLQGEHGIVH